MRSCLARSGGPQVHSPGQCGDVIAIRCQSFLEEMNLRSSLAVLVGVAQR